MVAPQVIVRTALAAFICYFEQVICIPTSTCSIPATYALSRTLWALSLLCVGITGSFLGALSARGPDDGDLEYRDQELAGSQIQEDTQRESPTIRSSTEAGTGATQEPVAEPRPAEPAQGSSSLTGSLRQDPAVAPRGERVSGLSRHVPSSLGISRTVAVLGRGKLTFGELAMEGFRREAKQLREEWEDEDRYVRQSVGRIIVGQSVPPTESQVKHLEAAARERFHFRASARVRQAHLLDQIAAEIAAQLQAAGVELSDSGGAASAQPGTSDEASGTGGDANAPGAGGARAAPEMAIQSYVRVGVVALRTEVTRLRELLRNKDLCVQQHIAERMARNMNENPSDNVVSLWRREAKRAYRLKATLAKEKAAALEAQATEWESRLASGALMREDPDEGPSFRRQASKRTSDTTAWTGGRAGSRGQWRKAHLTGRRRSPFIPRGPPLKSAPHIVHPGDTLRGTVLGSTVELPKLGEVPYAQLAIDKLRMEATQLYAKWKDKDEYVKCRIASHMHEGNNRSPREEDIRQWIVSAKHTYCRHGRVRIQEAAVLQELADNLERRAEAEGLMVRSSQESPAHGSESAGGLQAAESERVSGGPSHTPVPARSEMTFAHLAIQNLRKEAQNIEASWLRDEALFIAERAAYRMARANDPSPSPAVLLQWQYTDKSYFQTQCTAHLQKARDLRRQADALEVELESLLSSPSGHAPDPSLGTESTGKRQRKRKHLSQSSAESSGRHPLHGAATATPTSLWLTPVSGFPLRAPRRCSKRRRVASGPGSASPASLQLHPTEAASEKASGHSLSAPVPATRSTGVPLPPAALALSTTTPLHPAGSGSSAGVPAAPQPKKRRLLDFVSAQAAAHQLAPQMHTPPPGQISGTSTQIPFEHLPLGPREASGPSLTSFLSTGHATPFGPVSEIIPPRCLPLKKRPLREPAATIQSPTADVATSGPRRVSSDSLTVSSTSSGSHSQAPASTDSPAPTSAPHGVRGVGPRIRRGAPEPR